MSATVLPRRSFLELREKPAGLWRVDLVLPSPGHGLRGYRARLAAGHDRDAVLERARQSSAAMSRPLKIRCGS